MADTQEKQIILIVDDAPENIDVVRSILADDYTLKIALDGETAIELTHTEPAPDLILLDILMPGMDGYEVCKRLKEDPLTCNIPVVFVTGKGDVDDEKHGLELGAVDYIKKPFSPAIVEARVRSHLMMHKMQVNLEKMVEDRTASLLRSLEQTIHAMARVVEKKDPYTAGHQERVSLLSVEIAKQLGLDDEVIEGIKLAAYIHDLGKIAAPAEILNRPGRLTNYEFDIIKTHSLVGYDIVKDIEFPWPVSTIIRQHHERLDGSGYPDGISQDEIIIEARIIGIADVVEAMSSHRPYRPGLGIDAALEEIENGRGVRFDSDAVDACVRLFREQGFELPDAF